MPDINEIARMAAASSRGGGEGMPPDMGAAGGPVGPEAAPEAEDPEAALTSLEMIAEGLPPDQGEKVRAHIEEIRAILAGGEGPEEGAEETPEPTGGESEASPAPEKGVF